MKALGLMEFLGYLHAVDGLDAALKAADVRLRSCRRDVPLAAERAPL